MILATIIRCILMHATFGTFIFLTTTKIPLDGFAHTLMNVDGGSGRGGQIGKG
jgi:hypothetical protein